MLVKIDIGGHKVLRQTETEIIIAISKHSTALAVISVQGSTIEEFEANSALKGAYLGVGERGGFSVASF